MGNIQSFFQAAADGDVAAVRKMLRNNIGLLKAEDEDGWTALHIASSNGRVIVVRELLQQGACVFQADKKGLTALHYACWNENPSSLDVIGALLAGGAEANCRSTSGVTPLHLAVVYSRKKIVEALLDRHGAYSDIATDKGNTPFHLACKEGLLDMAKMLLRHDASKLNTRNRSGDTPLHLASANGHGEVALFLLEQDGIDRNIRNNKGELAFDCRASLCELVGQKLHDLVEKRRSNGDYQMLDDLVLEDDLGGLEEFQQTLMLRVGN